MPYKCAGCAAQFPKSKSLSIHQLQCSQLQDQVSRAASTLVAQKRQHPGSVFGSVIQFPKRRKISHHSDTGSCEEPNDLAIAGASITRPVSDSPVALHEEQENLLDNTERGPRLMIRIRIPAQLRDVPPQGPGNLQQEPTQSSVSSGTEPPLRIRIDLSRLPTRVWCTRPNTFGVWREYPYRPSVIPDLDASSSTFDNSSLLPPSITPLPQLRPTLADALKPFPNLSTFLQAKWLWLTTPTSSSMDHANHVLVKEVYSDPAFWASDVVGANFAKLKKKVAAFEPNAFQPSEGWHKKDVKISVPLGKPKAGSLESFPAAVKYKVPGLQHRSIVDIVRRVLSSDPNVADFHLYPYRELVQQDQLGPTPLRIIDDAFSSDAMLDEFRKLQESPAEPCCSLERVIIGLQFWSDATALAQFGSAKLWPLYMSFANQPKWARGRADMHACYDIAYIPSLPDAFDDFVRNSRGFPVSSELKSHCRKELFHAVWLLVMDKEFMRAYKHGILVKFPDGVVRRVYLRILTYSADYPEKVLIALIRDLGACPCPRCEIPKDKIDKMGLVSDLCIRTQRSRSDSIGLQWLIKRAKEFIYEDRYRRGVKSTWVEALLQKQSLVPTENAFSKRLYKYNFNYFLMLLVDLLHEFELGVWKAVLLHLIRMLHTLGTDAVHELNSRFRAFPPFGRNTIRRISYNVSDLKSLAGRDFEDILQCSIPAFEGLFPAPWDKPITDLLFLLCDWHSLAKLQLHTSQTLVQLTTATRALGQQLRHFRDTVAPNFATVELPNEAASRARRQARSQPAATAPTQSGARRSKTINLNTYKFHSLPDYPGHILWAGSSDVYNSQLGEARHRAKKRQYAKTNKRNFEGQIAEQTAVTEKMRLIDNQVAAARGLVSFAESSRQAATATLESVAIGPSRLRYFIATRGDEIRLSQLLGVNSNDPAVKHFQEQLLDHILARIRGTQYSFDVPAFNHCDYPSIDLKRDRLHVHGSLQFNYTTYNIRRSQDTVKPFLKVQPDGTCVRGNSDRNSIMLGSSEDDRVGDKHPFWYARVLLIFHVMVRDRSVAETSVDYQRMDVVWVRWLGRDLQGTRGGWKTKRLDRVGYVPQAEDAGAFGFVDPSDIIRACHLLPAAQDGRTSNLLAGPSFAQDFEGEDYASFHVSRFVDRDMSMRYRGGGIGHVDRAQRAQPEEYSTEDTLQEGCALDEVLDRADEHTNGDDSHEDLDVASGDDDDGDSDGADSAFDEESDVEEDACLDE